MLPSASVVHALKSKVDEAKLALEKSVKDILGKIDELESYVSSSASSLGGELGEALKGKIFELEEAVIAFSEKVSSFTNAFYERESSTLRSFHDASSSAIGSSSERLFSAINDLHMFSSSVLESVASSVSSSSQQTVSSVTKLVDEQMNRATKRVEDLVASQLSDFKSKASTIEKFAFDFIDSSSSFTVESIGRASSTIQSTVLDLVGQLQEMQKRLQDLGASLKSSLEEAKGRINQDSEKAKVRIKESFSLAVSDVEKGFSSLSGEVKLSLERLASSLFSMVEEGLNSLALKVDGMLKDAKMKVEESLKSASESIKQTLKNTQDTLSKKLAEHLESGKSSSAELVREVKEEVNKVLEAVRRISSETSEKVSLTLSPLSQRVTGELEEVKAKVEEITGAMKSIAFTEIVGVGLIAGYSNVKDYIRQVAKSAKSSLLIILPNLETADAEVILSISSRVALQIASSGDPALLRRISSRQNTTLRVLTEESLMGAVKDREEIVLAWIPPKKEQTIAICSTLEGYIEELSRPLKETWFKSKKLE